MRLLRQLLEIAAHHGVRWANCGPDYQGRRTYTWTNEFKGAVNDLLDKLATCSFCALHANAAYLAASTKESLPDLVTEASKLLQLHLSHAQELAGHGRMSQSSARRSR